MGLGRTPRGKQFEVPGRHTPGADPPHSSPERTPITCCPQKRGDVKRPPSPSDIHDAGRQAQMSSQRGSRMASCACGRLPEHRAGWVPASHLLPAVGSGSDRPGSESASNSGSGAQCYVLLSRTMPNPRRPTPTSAAIEGSGTTSRSDCTLTVKLAGPVGSVTIPANTVCKLSYQSQRYRVESG